MARPVGHSAIPPLSSEVWLFERSSECWSAGVVGERVSSIGSRSIPLRAAGSRCCTLDSCWILAAAARSRRPVLRFSISIPSRTRMELRKFHHILEIAGHRHHSDRVASSADDAGIEGEAAHCEAGPLIRERFLAAARFSEQGRGSPSVSTTLGSRHRPSIHRESCEYRRYATNFSTRPPYSSVPRSTSRSEYRRASRLRSTKCASRMTGATQGALRSTSSKSR